MKVQSTGLGKTVMEAELKGITADLFEGHKVMLMTMESYKPLHWTIKVHMEPADVRQAIFQGLKPSLIWKTLMALFFGRFTLWPQSGERLEESPASASAGPTATTTESATVLPGVLADPADSSAPNSVPVANKAGAPGVSASIQAEAPKTKKGRLPGILAHPDED